MRKENGTPLGIYTIGIAALFLAGFFLLVVFGAQSYRNTVAGQNANMHKRELLSYLSTAVKACDSRGAVSLREDPDFGSVLVLEDGNSGYALRVYRKDGLLLEDYAADELPLRPEEAQELGETGTFHAVLENGLLRIETDEGSVLLHLRGEGGT